MDEIIVDDGEVVAMIQSVEKLLAHVNEGGGTAGPPAHRVVLGVPSAPWRVSSPVGVGT